MTKSRKKGLEGSVWARYFLADGENTPLESSRRSLFFEAFHTKEFLVLGRADLNHDFFSTARASNLNTI